MKVRITNRHCDVSDDLREPTQAQIDKLSRYDPRVGSADVTYTEEKHTRKVDVVVHIDGAETVVAQTEGREFRTAIDKAIDGLVRMLKRERQQHRDHSAPPLSKHTREA